MSGVGQDLRDAIRRFAEQPHVLVAVDFDGTLAPLRDDPHRSQSVPGGIEALHEAAGLHGVTAALVSGRDLASLARLTGVTDDDAVLLVGSHGAETSHPPASAGPGEPLLDEAQSALLATVTAELEAVSAEAPGTRVEHKPAAAALHTRGMPSEPAAEALAAAQEVGGRHTGVHVTAGHDVVELGVVSVSKADAIRRLRSDAAAEAVAYFGDDVTDERAFAAMDPSHGDVRVRVGGGETLAEHHLATPEDVVQALQLFVATRRGSTVAGALG